MATSSRKCLLIHTGLKHKRTPTKFNSTFNIKRSDTLDFQCSIMIKFNYQIKRFDRYIKPIDNLFRLKIGHKNKQVNRPSLTFSRHGLKKYQ